MNKEYLRFFLELAIEESKAYNDGYPFSKMMPHHKERYNQDFTEIEIRGTQRYNPYVDARIIYTILCIELTNVNLTYIASSIDMHPSSIHHYKRTYKLRVEVDRAWSNHIYGSLRKAKEYIENYNPEVSFIIE